MRVAVPRFRFLRCVAFAFSCVVAFVPDLLHAQSAETLIDRGVERRRAGDDEGALALFVEAWDLSHAPRARAQMALAEQALGHFVDAEAHLLEALAAESDPWIESRRADLLRALEALHEKLGSLEIRGGVDGAEVRIDGRPIATLPLDRPLRLPTGTYRLEVVARRYYPFARSVTILPDGMAREIVVMNPMPVAVDSEAVSDAHADPGARTHSSASRALPFAVVGAGAALLATSGTFFALRQQRAREFASASCVEDGLTRGENCGGTYDAAIRAQRTSYATLGLGVASVAAGVVWLTVARPDSDEAPTAACTIHLGSESGGSCRWSF